MPSSRRHICATVGAFASASLKSGLTASARSPNSRYFYFTDTREGVPDGSVCHWNRTLPRVEVESGTVENLLPGVISPDKTLIAMADQDELGLWDLDDGEVARVPVPATGVEACTFGDYAAWGITWDSPDQVRLTDEAGAEWTLDVATRKLTEVE